MAFGSTCTSRMTELAWLTRHHIFPILLSMTFREPPLIPRRCPTRFLLTSGNRRKTKNTSRRARLQRRRRRRWQQRRRSFFLRIRGWWSATDRGRWYVLCHNKLKSGVRAQLSLQCRARQYATSATCSRLCWPNASRRLPFLSAECHTHWPALRAALRCRGSVRVIESPSGR